MRHQMTTAEFLTYMQQNHGKDNKLIKCNMTLHEIEIAEYLNREGIIRMHIGFNDVIFYHMPFITAYYQNIQA